MKKKMFFILLLVILCVFLSAQTSDSLTRMLEAETVTFNQVSYFAVNYLDLSKESIAVEEAGAVLKTFVSLPELKNTADALTFNDFAYICTRVWNIENGLNYRLFKSPRYALRELKALRFVPSFTDPHAYVSGRAVLHIMSKCAAMAEARSKKESAK